MSRFDLEERLVNYACSIISLAEVASDNYAAQYLIKQLIRSGNSAALNFAEAQGGESRNDFIHKMKVALKELRESFVCLKILRKSNLIIGKNNLSQIQKESNELISIFVKSIQTSQSNI